MEDFAEHAGLASPPGAARRLRAGALANTLALALIAAVAIAGLALFAQRYFAPLLLFPVLVGALLGGMLVAALRMSDAGHRASALAGAAVAALLLVGLQHYFSYLEFKSARSSEFTELSQRAALAGAFPELSARLEAPLTFGDFLRASVERGVTIYGRRLTGAGVWALWGADLLLSLAVSLAIVRWALGRPYCDACGSWFRASRRGALDAAAARALTQSLGGNDAEKSGTENGAATPPDQPAAGETARAGTPTGARYRLRACRGGCGPTGCELLWNDAGKPAVTAWLDAAGRDRVTSILDQSVAGSRR